MEEACTLKSHTLSQTGKAFCWWLKWLLANFARRRRWAMLVGWLADKLESAGWDCNKAEGLERRRRATSLDAAG